MCSIQTLPVILHSIKTRSVFPPILLPAHTMIILAFFNRIQDLRVSKSLEHCSYQIYIEWPDKIMYDFSSFVHFWWFCAYKNDYYFPSPTYRQLFQQIFFASSTSSILKTILLPKIWGRLIIIRQNLCILGVSFAL